MYDLSTIKVIKTLHDFLMEEVRMGRIQLYDSIEYSKDSTGFTSTFKITKNPFKITIWRYDYKTLPLIDRYGGTIVMKGKNLMPYVDPTKDEDILRRNVDEALVILKKQRNVILRGYKDLIDKEQVLFMEPYKIDHLTIKSFQQKLAYELLIHSSRKPSTLDNNPFIVGDFTLEINIEENVLDVLVVESRTKRVLDDDGEVVMLLITALQQLKHSQNFKGGA